MTSPTPSEERDVAGALDLVDRLSVKAAMISLGEKIAWGSEVDLMHEAAAEVTRLRAENARKDEALKPFAKAAELFPGAVGTVEFDQCIYAPAAGPEYSLCGDHLRAARAARMPANGRAALEQEGG